MLQSVTEWEGDKLKKNTRPLTKRKRAGVGHGCFRHETKLPVFLCNGGDSISLARRRGTSRSLVQYAKVNGDLALAMLRGDRGMIALCQESMFPVINLPLPTA